MNSYEAAAERLIDALPPQLDMSELQIHGGCPLAYDAGGTKALLFEAVALAPEVVRAQVLGEKSISLVKAKDIAQRISYPLSYLRLEEHASCLLTRARGECPRYDVENNRERTDEETVAFIKDRSSRNA